jgi:hypothetical protein
MSRPFTHRQSKKRMTMEEFNPTFLKWRHGGWYVTNVRYPNGAIGCVSRNYPDGKWRIVCDERKSPPTFPNRHTAALAEHELTKRKETEP